MEENTVVSDAVRLAKTILRSLLPDEKWAMVNIAKDGRESFVLEGFPFIPTSFGYIYDKTPLLLQKNKVIEGTSEGLWFLRVANEQSYSEKNAPVGILIGTNAEQVAQKKGYIGEEQAFFYYVDDDEFSFERKNVYGPRRHEHDAVLINRKALEEFIDKYSKSYDISRYRRNLLYENGELHLKLQDGSYCTLDLSKADEYRPVFESFYYLYRDTNRYLFDRGELLKKYNELTKSGIEWRVFIKRKSSIVGKMINPKSCLKNRIIWEYDKKEKKYRFEILPLSDR